jgi:hypothetical protein
LYWARNGCNNSRKLTTDMTLMQIELTLCDIVTQILLWIEYCEQSLKLFYFLKPAVVVLLDFVASHISGFCSLLNMEAGTPFRQHKRNRVPLSDLPGKEQKENRTSSQQTIIREPKPAYINISADKLAT